MAIAPMRRFELLGHARTKADVLAALQELGIAHLDDAGDLLQDVDEAERPPLETAPSPAEADARLQTVLHCLEFVTRYAERPSLAQRLTEPKPRVSEREFHETVTNFALDRVAGQVRELEREMAAVRTQINKLEVLCADLRHWTHMDIPLEEIRPSATVTIDLAVVDTGALPKLREDLAEITPLAHVEVLEEARPSSYLLLFVASRLEEQTTPVFKKYGCRFVTFPDLTGTPAEACGNLEAQIADQYERLRALDARAEELTVHRPALLVLADYYTDHATAARAETRMLHTRSTYFLTGWIPEREQGAIAKAVHAVSPATNLVIREPRDDERPPIQLDNPPATQPFEFISQMYGTPLYGGVDATSWLAPWFAVFFGLCLTDAGYGIALGGLAAFALRRLALEGSMRQLVRVLFLAGICTIVAGTLTGGWFGVSGDALPAPLGRLALIDPMEDTQTALYVCLLLGIAQVILGLGIRLLHNLRRGDTTAAIFDQAVWIVFILAVVPLLYVGLFGGTIESEAILRVAKIAALACTGIVILTGSREGGWISRPLMGLAKLYDMVGYFGDVLSYSRLLALGLATGAIGSAINMIAGQIAHALPAGIGYVLAGILVVFGHVFNLVVNALGGFIHSMRLQFIEFFNKFFDDGGRPFVPFAKSRTHVLVERP